ncbi:hypothetical protein BRADI_3g57360v3 [Brachypodium distachyon]|uniref:AP2/ERF domain-containing protein n=2 Tax=Brachypodium distachyon TaxID=15368 RepID=I1IEM9_BRADI|nr:hypothetical protein BRADI_3g57360v3 [Brachypodium distachyon]
MDGSGQWISFPSSSSSHDHECHGVAWSPKPKRLAGRSKFKETRHPVYRGVRRRGALGGRCRWVCEVRVPGKHGKRLWLGTHRTAESAGRAHDAAMLTLRGPSACPLNFPDSSWLLDVPFEVPEDLPGVRRAALAAVADFQCREEAATVPVVNESTSWATAEPSANNGIFEVPVAMGSGGMFELDMSGEMDVGMYYADLAEGLLMEPPQTTPDDTGACWESGEYAELWGCEICSLWL